MAKKDTVTRKIFYIQKNLSKNISKAKEKNNIRRSDFINEACELFWDLFFESDGTISPQYHYAKGLSAQQHLSLSQIVKSALDLYHSLMISQKIKDIIEEQPGSSFSHKLINALDKSHIEKE